MSNNIEVTVSLEEFKRKEPDEKLTLIYKAVSAQQGHCKEVTQDFDERIKKVESLELSPKFNKVKVAGGVGGLAGIAIAADRLIRYFIR